MRVIRLPSEGVLRLGMGLAGLLVDYGYGIDPVCSTTPQRFPPHLTAVQEALSETRCPP
jgi:hypothetical protein